MIGLVALALGACFGVALVLALVTLMRPAPVDVATAWHQVTTRENTPVRTGWHGHVTRALDHATTYASQTQHPWLATPDHDLAVLDQTARQYVTRRLGWSATGAAGALIATVLLALAGLALPWALAILVILGAAVLGALLPVFTLRGEAATARETCRRSLAVYLDLVAQERATGHAPTQALREAAAVGDNWVFARLRTQLAHATRTGHTPWQALRELGERYDVTELCDVADIAATAADGAAVHTSLTTKAAALRTAAVTSDRAEANARSERLSLPTSLLLIGFLLLVLYPTFIRLVTS